ncbi:hypothetical protein [Bacillus velezensis]|uniref:hypothetical protein n=1 Tax=Bacillus velezensis TaxID=492670 RepID=UPI002040B103|nr:hypothetical protein [Bacillus velezensis]MCM3448646.1 hypothetical protein [Bacillus velezensis]
METRETGIEVGVVDVAVGDVVGVAAVGAVECVVACVAVFVPLIVADVCLLSRLLVSS